MVSSLVHHHLFNLAMHFCPWFRNFAKFIGKHVCQNLFFSKVASPRHFFFSFRYFLLKVQPLKLDRHVKILPLRGLVVCRDVCSRKSFLWSLWFKLFTLAINPFSTNVPIMDKPGSWFLLAKYLKNTCGKMTF